MALPVGLQLGVELTNLVLPLTKSAVYAVASSVGAPSGHLGHGSDELTELRLGHIFGRLALDPAISTRMLNPCFVFLFLLLSSFFFFFLFLFFFCPRLFLASSCSRETHLTSDAPDIPLWGNRRLTLLDRL